MNTSRELTTIKLLEERLGKKIALAMASAFLDDTKDMGEKLEQCVSRKDAAALRRLTHKLAGCSASIMDKDTHGLCRSLEDLGDDQCWEESRPTYEALLKSLNQTRDVLTNYLKK